MRILLRSLLFTLPVFLFSLLRSFVQVIIAISNPVNHSELLIIIHEMCNARKKALPELIHPKETIFRNTFYELMTIGTG